MNQTPFLFLLLTLLLNSHSTHSQSSPHIAPTQPPSPSPKPPSPKSSPSPQPSSTTPSTLDPKQIRALQSLNLPTKKDPCTNLPKVVQCDNSKPFKNIISLHLHNCSDDLSLSSTALKSLSKLKDLELIHCPVSLASIPSELSSNLRSFTSINSVSKLSGVWLSRLENVTDLTVKDAVIKASGPVIIVAHLKKLNNIVLSHTNLSGELPGKTWSTNISHIDLSNNLIEGEIPDSMTELENLISLDLSSNKLTGVLPTSIGELIELKNLTLSSNSLSGSIPKSLISIPSLVSLDLSSNQLNGSIPKFIGEMKRLKYLNLAQNSFQGVLPFNESFIKRLEVFKIGDNINLCYNHTTISSKLKLGIAKCDKNGFPVAAPTPKESDYDDEDDDSSSEDSTSEKSGGSHGPNKVVLGVAIALSSIVFLIIFLICLSKKCT